MKQGEECVLRSGKRCTALLQLDSQRIWKKARMVTMKRVQGSVVNMVSLVTERQRMGRWREQAGSWSCGHVTIFIMILKAITEPDMGFEMVILTRVWRRESNWKETTYELSQQTR